VILLGFALLVGALTTRQLRTEFNEQVKGAATELQVRFSFLDSSQPKAISCTPEDLDNYARADRAAIRVFQRTGFDYLELCSTTLAPDLPLPSSGRSEVHGYRIELRPGPPLPSRALPNLLDSTVIQYARPVSSVTRTRRKVRLFLILGVLGGTVLALLAGLVVARRAMRPIAALTATAREIERTRDPGRRVPQPEARDEVAELARTLDEMLRALDVARAETEATLGRQRQFVADASHELRTPLTSVLANLELLADQLDGEAREAAGSALRSTHRMRRLVGDLLLLARADARREVRREPTDLAAVVREAAAELGSGAPDDRLSVATRPALVQGARDDLHRAALNLMENALRHTPEGTPVRVTVGPDGDAVVLVVEDDGPGIPPELRERVFDRFVRGSGDHGTGSGLGLAIVRAVAEFHGGTISVAEPASGTGTRFVLRLPAAGATPTQPEPTPLGAPV